MKYDGMITGKLGTRNGTAFSHKHSTAHLWACRCHGCWLATYFWQNVKLINSFKTRHYKHTNAALKPKGSTNAISTGMYSIASNWFVQSHKVLHFIRVIVAITIARAYMNRDCISYLEYSSIVTTHHLDTHFEC